ncbi:FAD-dependent urate hydroxylase HpxO [Alkalinema pantanalense CENA528]|uniref:FAD-dependent urate hydroxylase HpxO n=1 Tax=Alkalinema pantanalense TaxID=1620705 RepID=UPI003D6E18AB
MQGLKAIVIGAGIGGLTAGIALQRAGYEVEIYDRVQELKPVGAGISLWSNGVKVLNWLGLGAEIARIGGRMARMEYRWLDGRILNDIDLAPLVQSVGQCPYPVARADLQAILLQAFNGDVHLHHCCMEIEQTDRQVTARFENGHCATGDFLVAANGVRSNLREYVLGQPFNPKYAGYVNFNGLVAASEDLAPPRTWVIYVGQHQRASMMPVANDRFYFFLDVPLPLDAVANPAGIQAELHQHFHGWADPVQRLIDRLDPQATARLAIHDLGPIDRLVKGRVALLGDAAHTTCPDLGQGGCQAMEDALVLAQCLVTTNVSVEDALQRYERQRHDRVSSVVKKARQRAEMIHGKDPQVTQQWYDQLATEDPLEVTGAIAKTILGGPLH